MHRDAVLDALRKAQAGRDRVVRRQPDDGALRRSQHLLGVAEPRVFRFAAAVRLQSRAMDCLRLPAPGCDIKAIIAGMRAVVPSVSLKAHEGWNRRWSPRTTSSGRSSPRERK